MEDVMNKTKKALLAAFACSAVLAGAFGLAACNNSKPAKHEHVWSENWTVATKPTDSTTGKATRTCSGTGTCDATADDKEYTLPVLSRENYTEGTDSATCSAAGSIEYTYNKDGVNVSFNVDTPVKPAAHNYGTEVNTDPAGHYQVCGNNSAHKTEQKAHDTNGTNGACSVCGYLETAIQLKTDVTVTGATTAAPKLYSLTVEADEYELLVSGNAVDTNTNTQIAIGTYTDGTFTAVKTGAQRTLTLTAGKYYIQASANVTFKLAPASEHQHAFNESVWEKNDTKHWHPAICVHTDEKSGEDDHSYVWDDADRDGVQEGACECGQTSVNYNATALNSSEHTLTVAQTGNYSSTIVKGSRGTSGGIVAYGIAAQNYTLTNGSTAKKYTVKILSDNTSITPAPASGINAINEEGASFSVVLEADETLSLTLSTNDGATEDENYAVGVAFRVIVEDAPALGTIERPIKVTETSYDVGKEGVKAGEKVYFKLCGAYGGAFYNKDVGVSFGIGITVYSLGESIKGTPAAIDSGDKIALTYGSDCYLYSELEADGDCYLGFEASAADGGIDSPVYVEIGSDKTNNAPVDFDTQTYWFKMQSAEGGKYIFKPDSDNFGIAHFKLFDKNDDEYAEPVAEGSVLVVNLKADTPVYIAASSDWQMAFTFTVTEFTDADKGLAASDPLEITNGTAVKDGTFYYTYTATASGMATLNFVDDSEEESELYIYQYSDATFAMEKFVSSGVNTYSFVVESGKTYYITTNNDMGVNGTVSVEFKEFQAHEYVITVTDGTNTYDSVTVTLVYTEDEVEHEVTGATNNGDGTYTFAGVDPSKKYSVKITGLGNKGYYAQEAVISPNVDTKTELTITVEEKHEYKVKVALPDGAVLPEGATLEGIKVTLTIPSMGGRDAQESGASKNSYTVGVGADGVATFSILDPAIFRNGNKIDSAYYVSVEVPEGHSLYGKFAYITYQYETVDGDKRDITDEPLELTAVKVYTVLLKDGENNFAAGTKVTVDEEEYTIGADGTFTIISDPESVDYIYFEIKGYAVGELTVDSEANTITATCEATTITVGQLVTVAGLNEENFEHKEYEIQLEAGKSYDIVDESGASILDYFDVCFGNEKDMWTGELTNCDASPLKVGGTYYVWLFINVTFKVIEV